MTLFAATLMTTLYKRSRAPLNGAMTDLAPSNAFVHYRPYCLNRSITYGDVWAERGLGSARGQHSYRPHSRILPAERPAAAQPGGRRRADRGSDVDPPVLLGEVEHALAHLEDLLAGQRRGVAQQ